MTKQSELPWTGERFLPDAGSLRRKIEAGSEAMMALTPEQFVAA